MSFLGTVLETIAQRSAKSSAVDKFVYVDELGQPRSALEGGKPAQHRIELTIETIRTKNDFDSNKWKNTQAENRGVAKAALFDLSQQDDDRKLLEFARTNKIKIIFDPVETSCAEADGFCDFKKNAIVLKPGKSVGSVQYTIIHELQHMFDRANGLVADAGMSMKSGLIMSRALEANARTTEARHAWGCEFEIAPGFYKPKGVVECFERDTNIPEMITAARAASEHLKAGDKDRFSRDVFASFYREKKSIEFYDEGKLSFLNEFAPDPGNGHRKVSIGVFKKIINKITSADEREKREREKIFHKRMSSFMLDESVTHDKISEKIPFLNSASFSLEAPEYCSLSHTMETKYAALVNKISTLASRTGDSPKLDVPIHYPAAQAATAQVAIEPTTTPVQRMLNQVDAQTLGASEIIADLASAQVNSAGFATNVLVTMKEILPTNRQAAKRTYAA